MISLEMRDKIDDIATDIAVLDTGKERRQAINMALLKYAEKVDELENKLIEHNANSASVGAADAEENWTKEKDDLLRDKAYWQLEAQAKYRELVQLKKFQIWFYKKQFGFETDKSALSNIDSDYAEWCKQNLK